MVRWPAFVKQKPLEYFNIYGSNYSNGILSIADIFRASICPVINMYIIILELRKYEKFVRVMY